MQTPFVAADGAELCAVFIPRLDGLQASPVSRRPPGEPLSVDGVYYVPLGLDAITGSDWERLRDHVEERIEDHLGLLQDDALSPRDVNLWEGLMDGAQPVLAAVDVLRAEDDETLIDTRHVLNPVDEGERIGCLHPYTTDEALVAVSRAIAECLEPSGEAVIGESEWLKEQRDELREQSPHWGELSPYLEALLAEGHPKVRLKRQGKYNPSGARIVLIRVREVDGDGGWEPAVVNESAEAFQQWSQAGIAYPEAMLRKAAARKTATVLHQVQDELAHNGTDSVIATVQTMHAQRQELEQAMRRLTGSYRQEVAARAQAAISRILASAVESPEIRREDTPRLLAKGYRVLGDALEQLAVLPECPLDSTTARHTGPVWSLAFGKDTLATASKTAEAYLVKLEAVRQDGATAQLRTLLTRLNQASSMKKAFDPE